MNGKEIVNAYLKNELDIKKLSLEEISVAMERVSKIKSLMSAFDKELKEGLQERFKDDLTEKRKEFPFGIISVLDGDFTFSETKPRKVKWDQKELEKLYYSSEKIKEIVDVKYNISEKTFKESSIDVQKTLEEAREVSYGSTSIKLKRKEDK